MVVSREVIVRVFIESKDGVKKRYLVPLSKHILVQDNDFVRAGMPLSDGAIHLRIFLRSKGQLQCRSIWSMRSRKYIDCKV